MIRWILPLLLTCFGCSFLIDPTYPEDPNTMVQDQSVQERDVSADTIDAMRMSDQDLPDMDVPNDDMSVTADAGIASDEGVQVDAMVPEPECSTFADCLSGQICLPPQCDSEACSTPSVAACEDSTTAERCELASALGTSLEFADGCCLPSLSAPEEQGTCTKPIPLQMDQSIKPISLRDLKRRQFKQEFCTEPSANASGFYRDIVFKVASGDFGNASTICVRSIETTTIEGRLSNNTVYLSLFPVSGCCAQDLSIMPDSCRTAPIGDEDSADPFVQLNFPSTDVTSQTFGLRIWIDDIVRLEDVPNLPIGNESLGLLESTFEVLGGVTCCENDADCGDGSCTDGVCE